MFSNKVSGSAEVLGNALVSCRESLRGYAFRKRKPSKFVSVLKSYCRLPLVRSNDLPALRTSRPSEAGNGCHGFVAGLRAEASLGTRPQWHPTTLEGLSASGGGRWVSGPAAPRLYLLIVG